MNKLMTCSVKEAQEMASYMNLLKDKLMRHGLYRTAHLIDIPQQEIGWEMQGLVTPDCAKRRQQETLTP